MSDLLIGLNPEQAKAVKQIKGPVLVLAGAGSGKTKALTHRVAYLVNEKKISPDKILAITFTNKAAGEMRERVKQIIGAKSNKNFHISTFHSFCARMLRRESHHLGYAPSFSILDANDQLTAIKQAMEQLQMDTKKIVPEAVRSHISSAKNELLDEDAYAKIANGAFQQAVAKIYRLYQDILRRAQAMDFDDLLMNLVVILQQHPEVLDRYQNQFQYILIDEYQDTNTAQYRLSQLLASKHHNLFVVGDDWQCLVPDTLIETQKGIKKIQDIAKGELVKSASGYGNTDFFKVTNKKRFAYNGEIIKIKTASGKILSCTPNHLLFFRWDISNSYFVYLMYSQTMGYRIGTAMGTRFDGKKYDTGLRVRANQERADRMWVIKVCDSHAEAIYTEALFAYKYGIPILVFHAYSNRALQLNQKQINELYRQIDTKSRANQLMADIGLVYEYPHFSLQATTQNDIKRVNLNVVLFGDKRMTQQSPWSASRISCITTDANDLKLFEKLGYTIRPGRNSTYRTEIHNLDYGKLEQIVEKLKADLGDIQVTKYAFLTDKRFSFMPAGQIHPSMLIPLVQDGQVIEDRVVEVNRQSYIGAVYDLDIEKVHNYIASGMVVHNSIYSWRGANFRNILNFHNDYPDAKIIKLEQNYRSTQNILDSAHAVIAHNKHRSDKKLWTDQTSGELLTAYEALNEKDEGDFIIREITAWRGRTKASLNDFVILYRTNAQSRALEETMLRAGIKYRVIGGMRFYERKEIKDMLAFMKLLHNPGDNLALGRVINLPARGIGKKTLQALEQEAKEADVSMYHYVSHLANPTPAIRDFVTIMKKVESKSATLTLSRLLDFISLHTGYQTMLKSEGIEGETRLENITELKSVMEKYDHLTPKEALATFLEEVALISDIDNVDTTDDAVTMMTMHTAKGLEFDFVFIVGAEENLFPHSRSLFDQEELEEERRLCYVGITRARKKVYFTYAQERLIYGSMQSNHRSRFIDDLPDELVEFVRRSGQVSTISSGHRAGSRLQPGVRVVHQKFGPGTVISQSGDIVTVAFVKTGIKDLSAQLADLKVKA